MTLRPGDSEQVQGWCVRYRCARCLKVGRTRPDFSGPAKPPTSCEHCKSKSWETPRNGGGAKAKGGSR